MQYKKKLYRDAVVLFKVNDENGNDVDRTSTTSLWALLDYIERCNGSIGSDDHTAFITHASVIREEGAGHALAFTTRTPTLILRWLIRDTGVDSYPLEISTDVYVDISKTYCQLLKEVPSSLGDMILSVLFP